MNVIHDHIMIEKDGRSVQAIVKDMKQTMRQNAKLVVEKEDAVKREKQTEEEYKQREKKILKQLND